MLSVVGDVTIIVGVTPICDCRGAMLCVIKEHDGKVWYIKLGSSPSKKVSLVWTIRVFFILKNNIEHFVSILQNGNI